MRTKKPELLSRDATPAEIETAIEIYLQEQNRPSISFVALVSAIFFCTSSLACFGFFALSRYPEAIFSFLLSGVTSSLLFFQIRQISKSMNDMGSRLFDHPAPLTFRQTLLGYSCLSEKRKTQSIPDLLRLLREVTKQEIAMLSETEQKKLCAWLVLNRIPEIVLEAMNLVQRLERIEALPFLEKIVKKQAGLYKNREVRARAREVAEFLRPLAALQRTEAQLLRPAPATTPSEQLLRVPQEMSEPEINLLRPVE